MKIYATRLKNLPDDLAILKAIAGTDTWILVSYQGGTSQDSLYYHKIVSLESNRIRFKEVGWLSKWWASQLRDETCADYTSLYLRDFSIVRPIETLNTQEILDYASV